MALKYADATGEWTAPEGGGASIRYVEFYDPNHGVLSLEDKPMTVATKESYYYAPVEGGFTPQEGDLIIGHFPSFCGFSATYNIYLTLRGGSDIALDFHESGTPNVYGDTYLLMYYSGGKFHPVF